jgi:serine protease
LSIPAPLLQGAPPVNATPAQVINMSLGGLGSCSATYTQAVADIAAKGVLIVASAGNEGGPVDIPANCPGVLAVAGLRHVGTKVGYSNLGPEVGIAAPAGNCVNTGATDPCLFSLVTTTDSGSQGPVGPDYTNAYNYNVGTSFSAPLAAAAAALMRAVNPGLTPKQLIARLQTSARAFPATSDTVPTPSACHTPAGSTDVQSSECLCTTSVCGAGMLDTGAAVLEALRPSAVAGYSGIVATGRTLTVDGSASGVAVGRGPASYRWTVASTSGGATSPAFANPTAAVTTVLSPSVGSYTVRLTVTDSTGATDTADITVQATDTGGVVTPTTPPSSGGGGGAVLPPALLGLAVLAALRRRRTRPRRLTRA